MKGLFIIAITLTIFTGRSFAYNYGEHKLIGDAAFLRFLRSLPENNKAQLLHYLDIRSDEKGRYYFGAFSGPGQSSISYGILNGLSGDHERNPLLLEEQLHYQHSVMEQIIRLHDQYIEMGYTAAPDAKLSKLDFSYALKAAVNLSHFYEYRKGFPEQLRHFSKASVRLCEKPALVDSIFKKLGRTNAINMYVTLHVLAIDLAEQSGFLSRQNEAASRQLLLYAMLFNAFADHFLEDAFSAGHLVVNRTVFESITNNKSLHDFYSANGATVVNRKGEIWHAYGDGQFNNPHHSWQKDTTLKDIRYATFTPEAERIIHAVTLSLQDLSEAFQRGAAGTAFTPFLDRIPDNRADQPLYLIRHIPSLTWVPIPYRSDMNPLFDHPGTITAAMRQANAPLRYRDFVRSRVGNSFVIGLTSGPAFIGHYIQGPEIRINAGNFLKHFDYNSDGGKKGLMDYWLGYTVSGSFASLKDRNAEKSTTTAQQVRAGIKGNFDYWVSNKRFIGLYTYVEAGAQFTSSRTTFVFVPSLGIQLSSLLNINVENMKSWARIPLQFILPLKLRYGVVVSGHEVPRYFTSADIDILL
ncbi:hypothetical protein SAMN04488128_106171 [Chitinophaga eiseniae]|uniref:Uncharacterized protein n=1 Tax=Chitinophaga eiseniae TaxID=634771 RepID=A0A1T4TSC6_9BACT|nr:hypothetical protein [Chitinophaga eiseniae]SKA43342.1 hypothetical protein SAMN04488128_106171 [Chitinophaga eiseniae]